MTNLSATHIGKAVARSGLLPATLNFLIEFLTEHYEEFTTLLPNQDNAGDLDGFFFALANACLQSPEFGQLGYEATRILPWQIDALVPNAYAEEYEKILVNPAWNANLPAANGAMIALKWMSGTRVAELEGMFGGLRLGPVREICRNINWIFQGLADVIAVSTVPHLPDAARPPPLRGNREALQTLRKFPRIIRRLAWRVSAGLPDSVVWMTQLEGTVDERSLTRREVVALYDEGMVTPEQAMDGGQESNETRMRVFVNVQPSAQRRANWVRDAARDWKRRHRERMAEWQKRRAKNCEHLNLLEEFYTSLGSDFETAFEHVLDFLEIEFEKLDTGQQPGRPDYKITIADFDPIVFELKTKQEWGLIGYNEAVEVLAASEVHGLGDKFCVTLCNPGVDPAVPNVIVECGRLSVVDSAALGEALLRFCERTLTGEQLFNWLTTPGQALESDLPFSTT